MDKSIALAVNFGKAPLEIQTAARASADAAAKLAKLQKQKVELEAKIAAAEIEDGKLEKAIRVLLNAWDPTVETTVKP